MYTFSLDFTLLATVLILNGVLAFWAVRTNPRNATNRLFGLFSFLVSLWLIANHISIQPEFLEESLFWIRATITLAVPLTSTLFVLAHTMPYPSLRLTRFGVLVIVMATFAVMGIAASPYAFSDVVIGENGIASPRAAPGIVAFGAFVIIMIAGSLGILAKKLRGFHDIQRRQILFIILGIGAMFGAIIFTIVLPVAFLGITFFVPLSPLYTLFFLTMTAYAVMRHHLFNLRVITTEIFTTLIASVSFVNIFLSRDQDDFFIRTGVFFMILIFSFLLIRGTLREIRALEEVSRTKSEFVSIASHQLRTPLTATKGYVSMILEGSYGEVSAKVQNALKMVYASNERLVRIVNDLLDISRMEMGKFQYIFAKVSLPDLITNVVQELSIAAEIKHLRVVWEAPKDPTRFFVRADEEKLLQTFLNILDNAIKYTARGSITIKLAQDIRSGYIRVSVQDTGIGISEEDRVKLFEQFVRGKEGSRANAAGSGIGLYIAKKIVEDHRGRIWAESEGSGKGSTFIVILPAYRQASAEITGET